MFLGTHSPRLDDKGRLFLPAKFRDRMLRRAGRHPGPGALPLRLPDGRVRQGRPSRCRRAPTTSKAVRDFTRVFLSGASDEVPDKQGRVTIPTPLRAYAGLSRECTVIGAGSRVEVWDSAGLEDLLGSHRGRLRRPSEEVIPGLFGVP